MENMHELCLKHVRADRALRGIIAKQLEPYRLTIMEWLALGVISSGSKNGLSMSEIAAALGVTLPQVTALVANLSELKCIKQKVLAADHRGRQVIITSKGQRTLAKLETVIRVAMRNWSHDLSGNHLWQYIQTVRQRSQHS